MTLAILSFLGGAVCSALVLIVLGIRLLNYTRILETEKKYLLEKLQDSANSKTRDKEILSQELLNLTQNILDQKTAKFTEQTEKNLDLILRPLKEKIVSFEKTVEEKYAFEAKERNHLKGEIESLMKMNDRMAVEANSLTKALRGDIKIQGDWGEMVLEKILEASGLREGQEYSTQKFMEGENGERLRPDVIVNLPEEKHVIVDSKVSLRAYDNYLRTDDVALREKALREHLESMDKHINQLADKHYSRMKGVHSPEFVFMFVPIEPAYLLALQKDQDLSSRAWKKGVALVTSTTLLTSLKTVAGLWRIEKQNKNALQIADEGGKLYDKFVSFLEDFEKVGQAFETGHRQYHSALSKLREGPGNIFRKMEQLRELGAAPKKNIRPDLIDGADPAGQELI